MATTISTIDTIQRLVEDKQYFIEHILTIEDKQRHVVPFILKPIQLDMLLTRTGRDIYLKPAQVGSTSLHMADFFHDCITRPGTNSVVIAHEEFITQRLLNKVHSFTNQLEQIPGFPKVHHQSSYEITWPSLNSSFYIGSARSYVFGRGEVIHNLLGSEYAFWPDTSRIIGPALQRVPPDGNITIESTPNGRDNDFHQLYSEAKSLTPIGASRFATHFYPWTQENDYRLPPDSPYALPKDRVTPLDYTEEELAVIRKLDATEDQIRWRRMKVAELEQLRQDGRTALLFSQEFPEDDESCFLSTGTSAYDAELLSEMAKHCYKATHQLDGFKVWELPKKDFRYIVSIDPGMALHTKTAITVWRFYIDHVKVGEVEREVERGVHCATLCGLIGPEETARKAMEIATLYNRALIAPEANNHGLAVLAFLKPYSNIYLRKDIVSGKVTPQLGWLTTPRTKPHMVAELVRMLPNLEIHDLDIISELRNMRTDGDMVVSSSYDDLHDATAIAVACRQSKPITRGFVGAAGYSGGKWGGKRARSD